MDARDLEPILEVADVIQVGARNMQNYPLLTEIGRSGCPVLIKRGLSSTLEELLMAAEYVLKEGNERVMLCERGIRTFETAYRFTLDLTAVPVLKELSHLPVIVDPSHAAGRRALVTPLSLAAAAVGADGDHRRGAPRARGGDLRRAPGAARRRVRRVRGARGGGRRGGGQGARARLKLAVLGVGLIGGSVGMAARDRLGAEVAGWDPAPEALTEGRARGALDRAAGSPADALEGAEVAVVAAPVDVLPGVVGEALAAAGEGCVVTDVGLHQARGGRRRTTTRASWAATRWRAPRPPACATRAPTSSRARPGT